MKLAAISLTFVSIVIAIAAYMIDTAVIPATQHIQTTITNTK